MENEMETLGPLKGVYRDIPPIYYKYNPYSEEGPLISKFSRHFHVLFHLIRTCIVIGAPLKGPAFFGIKGDLRSSHILTHTLNPKP